MPQIILASNSPRRKMLLEQIGLPFTIAVSSIDEKNTDNLSPIKLVEKLSLDKAKAILQKNPGALIIGADTIVVYNNTVFGKPLSPQSAKKMLHILSNHTHEIFTGITIATREKTLTKYEQTKIWMSKLTEEEIDAYVATGEPLDKAGSYGIQEKGVAFIEKIEGEYTNVVGLPLPLLISMLKTFGIELVKYWNKENT